jgi:hypothetical protein
LFVPYRPLLGARDGDPKHCERQPPVPLQQNAARISLRMISQALQGNTFRRCSACADFCLLFLSHLSLWEQARDCHCQPRIPLEQNTPDIFLRIFVTGASGNAFRPCNACAVCCSFLTYGFWEHALPLPAAYSAGAERALYFPAR